MTKVTEAETSTMLRRQDLLHEPAGITHLIRGGKTRMLIPLVKIVAMLRESYPEADAGLIKSRVKYSVRNGFPRDFETGHGQRTSFDIRDGLMMFMAFELMRFGATNAAVINDVTKAWPEIERILALAWHIKQNDQNASQLFILATGHSLNRDDSSAARFEACRFDDIATHLERISAETSVMVIGAADFVLRFRAAAEKTLAAHDNEVDEEMALVFADHFGHTSKSAKELISSTVPAPA